MIFIKDRIESIQNIIKQETYVPSSDSESLLSNGVPFDLELELISFWLTGVSATDDFLVVALILMFNDLKVHKIKFRQQ